MTWTLHSGHISPQGKCPSKRGNLTVDTVIDAISDAIARAILTNHTTRNAITNAIQNATPTWTPLPAGWHLELDNDKRGPNVIALRTNGPTNEAHGYVMTDTGNVIQLNNHTRLHNPP